MSKQCGGSGTVVVFHGEAPWDAVVSTYCLDIIEESCFCGFCVGGADSESPPPQEWPASRLVTAYQEWIKAGARR